MLQMVYTAFYYRCELMLDQLAFLSLLYFLLKNRYTQLDRFLFQFLIFYLFKDQLRNF
jgi:hypothetical protein